MEEEHRFWVCVTFLAFLVGMTAWSVLYVPPEAALRWEMFSGPMSGYLLRVVVEGARHAPL